jgi:hypothetical protein
VHCTGPVSAAPLADVPGDTEVDEGDVVAGDQQVRRFHNTLHDVL